jgi:L-lactate dehydrogenase complex protein LldF
MLVHLRHRKVKMKLTSLSERIAFKSFQTVFGKVTVYKMITKSAYYLQKPFVRNGSIQKGPGPISGWTQSRFFPMKPKRSFRERWEELQKQLKNGGKA